MVTNPKIIYKEDYKGWGRYAHNSEGSIIKFIYINSHGIFISDIVASGNIDIDNYIKMDDSGKDKFLLESINTNRSVFFSAISYDGLMKYYPQAASKLREYKIDNILDEGTLHNQ